ncbi:MAG: efflux RND transporter permease subunit [Roseofilum sp. SBFL]|uniref:efflux RND transporter permease subunit n=1 Tax=unclassified Roseofilum TaxID=2620099 RepID=UPI001AFD39B4|nr:MULTISPECIES: efflux RND transporter permease subunit [unclassified Roseofilum]MBP0015563.1 efflux RND transporter permease subunit [Roseofilum sp. SID3]MBP0022660.1 efflux RND transporter permease subunit [Roseofilum sp. SID2]MBP0039220.1 efflux RND transporter permease subunit [Roseofilum sp. SID1]MBP0042698.1 efflux RND transporter permease subunit [Roseofilum sp. SBFL]
MSQTPSSLSAIAIRRHIGTLMLTIAVIVVGFFALSQLPVDLLPAITYPRIGVRVDTPGLAPQVAVDEVTRPLEEGLAATEGVVQVFSETREGRVSLNLYFNPGSDIDQALNDATATLNRTINQLPDDLEPPRIFKFDPSQLPVYEFALTSDRLQGVDLRVFGDRELARELTVVPGVAGVDVSGGLQEEVQVNLDLKRMTSLGITINDVLDNLRDRNLDSSGGRLRNIPTESLTRTIGRFANAQDILNLSFELNDSPSSRQVYLRDFAQVIDGTERQQVLVSLNGIPAVKVSVQKQPEANTVQVVDAVKARIEELRSGGIIPDDMILTSTLDESRFIRQSIRNVVIAGLTGSGLAAIAVLLFLGSLRQTLIVILAIPLATLTAIILMFAFGLSLNVFSLGGLALGVGIVVDNSIVMLENMVSQHQALRLRSERPLSAVEGDTLEIPPSPYLEAQKAASQLESALLASTSTNLVAVLPFVLIGGFFSLLFNELILTISFSVAASLIVSLTVVPMLTSRLLRVRRSSGLDKRGPLRWFNQQFLLITGGYGRILRGVIRVRILAIALAVLILGYGSVRLAADIPQEILPRINTGQARLFAQFPPGSNLETNQKVMEAVDRILVEQPETEYAFTTTGGFLFANLTIENLLRSSSTITLKPGSNVQAFVENVQRELNQLNLVNIRLRLFPDAVRGLILNNSPVRGDIDVAIATSLGPDGIEDPDILAQAGRQVLKALDENVTLARFRPDADPSQLEVQIRPDWERMADFGVTAQELGTTLETAISGTVPTRLQRGNRLVDIRVQLNRDALQRIDELRQMPLFSQNNSPIRLQDIASLDKGTAPAEIQRVNGRSVFFLVGNLNQGASLSDALGEVDAALENLELPPGARVLPSVAAESNQQLQEAIAILGSLAAFLVFVVMAVQYNSLIDPLVIMLAVPLALAGGILGLYLTETAIGATVLVGGVLLVGIVVNNAIIMVELANQIRAESGLDYRSAILRAAPQRLRPILMTTITTVLGLFPLAVGSGEGGEFLQPLGVVVFSGLSLATLLTLFMIPCFYVLLHEDIGEKLLRLPKK